MNSDEKAWFSDGFPSISLGSTMKTDAIRNVEDMIHLM
jgi:hypothetical protein